MRCYKFLSLFACPINMKFLFICLFQPTAVTLLAIRKQINKIINKLPTTYGDIVIRVGKY